MIIKYKHKHLYEVTEEDGKLISSIKFNCCNTWVLLGNYTLYPFKAQDLIQIGNFMLGLKNPDTE